MSIPFIVQVEPAPQAVSVSLISSPASSKLPELTVEFNVGLMYRPTAPEAPPTKLAPVKAIFAMLASTLVVGVIVAPVILRPAPVALAILPPRATFRALPVVRPVAERLVSV